MVQLARTGFGPQHNFRKNNAPVECVRLRAEIDLLIGADVMGRLLTGNVVTLHSGLTAIEKVLGITDPTETVKEREDLSGFREKMRILPEGRYEVELPWKSNLMNLCDNNDVLKCCADLEPLTCEVRITKRLILSVVQKIFDPIGLLTPTTLLPKLLLQNLWKLKISWDHELPHNELVCNVGVRLVNSLMKALNFPNLKITFWSDSTTALWWIKEQGNWSVFVSNRVKEIRLLTKTHSWKHVPGNMNPADLLSRGCSPYKLLKSKWWEGPAWSKENPQNWPTGEIIDQPSEIEVERRKIKIVNIDLANDAPLLWHLHNISNYSKMIKVFGWIWRFIYNCRKPCDKCTEPELSFYEIKSSERCQRFKVKAMSSEPAPLPLARVADCVAFEIVGIDLAGPLFLKSGEKVWIALFTCAHFRSIHLELVNSLTADSFLLSLRRFVARRGRPRTIYSDNGTNFRCASNDLSKLDWDKITRETMTNKILWKFIPPSAAWWERLVRIVKELLRRTLGKCTLTYEELNTILCDCELIINCRPLTYVSEDPG
ncbi:integrase catalytic domain-containing protein [Trichonephila clavipes]|nr:integrase catalytic domain-containing protein [Trichonephila clavipes]